MTEQAIDFESFYKVVESWLHKFFKKYPEKRDVIIIDGVETEDEIVDTISITINEIMCSLISMLIVNRKYKYNLYEWDLYKKRVLRPFNEIIVENFLEEVRNHAKVDDIPFFGEFSEGF